MDSSRSLKCSNCAKRGLKCVDTSWKSLDETRKATRAKIEEDIEELSNVLARLNRHRKVLALAESRAKEKTICLLDELDEEEKAERETNGGLSNGEIAQANADLSSFLATADGSTPVDWSAMGFSDETPIASGGPSSGAT